MRTNGPIFAGASDDPSMPVTLVAILSLLPRTATPFLSGAWVELAAPFSIGLAAAQFAPNLITPLTKPSRGGDRRQDDVVVTQR
jgi:hypothetical protein